MEPTTLDELRTLTSRVLAPDLLEQVFEHGHDAQLIIGPDGTIVMFNRAATLMFGLTKTQAIGQFLEVLLPDHLRAQHLNHRNKFMDNPRSRSMGTDQELIGKHTNGSEFKVDVGLTPIQSTEGLFISALIRKRIDG